MDLKKYFSSKKIHTFNYESKNNKEFLKIFGNDNKVEKIVSNLKKDGIFLKENKNDFKKKSDMVIKDYKVKLWDKAIYPEKMKKNDVKIKEENKK